MLQGPDMSRALIPLALITLMGGCAAVLCQLEHNNSSAIAGCEASYPGFEYKELHEDRGQKEADSERAARERAAPACDRGDPRSCLTVAVYDERHHGSRSTIVKAYAVACRGSLAFGCYGAGRFEHNPTRALPLLARGCELGEMAACEAAAAMDPVHATDFHEAACWLNQEDACQVAALSWIYGTGVPADPGRGRTLLMHGCDHGSVRACALLKRIR